MLALIYVVGGIQSQEERELASESEENRRIPVRRENR